MGDRVFASLPLVLLGFVQTLGMTPEEFFLIAELSPQDLADPDALVDYECLIRVWTELVRRHGREPLGIRYAELVSVEVLGVVGYVARHGRTVRQAAESYLRFSKLADPRIAITIEELDAHRTAISIRHEPRVEAMVEPIEMMNLSSVRLTREFVEGDVEPLEVCFRHPQRHPSGLYEASLGTVPLRFEAAITGAVWRTADLERPIRGADPRMASYLEQHAERLLAELPRGDSLDERVRRAIDERLLVDEADQTHVAKAFGMSVRSLQRGLRACGTTFSRELDTVRRTRAELLLGRPELSAGEIAFMLGYRDPRAFFRSFRRWTGMSPTAFRRERFRD